MKKIVLSALLMLGFHFAVAETFASSNTRSIQLHKDGHIIEFTVLVKLKKPIEPKRDRLYYWHAFDQVQVNEGAFSGQLLHGSYRVFDASNRLIEQGAFEEGQKSGTWYKWAVDGKVLQETEWKNSKKHGQSKLYSSGNLRTVEQFKDDLLHGNRIRYDVDGKKEISKYRLGQEVVKPIKEKKKPFFRNLLKKIFKPKEKTIQELEETSEWQE